MAVNPKSLQNLNPAKPGEVRSPGGRGKGNLNFETRLKKWLKTNSLVINPLAEKKADGSPPDPTKMQQLDIMILAQIAEARKGKTKAFVAIMDRVHGKPIQQSKVVSENTNYNHTMPPMTPEETREIGQNLEDAV